MARPSPTPSTPLSPSLSRPSQFDIDSINAIVEEEIQLRRFGNVKEVQGRGAKADVFSAWEQDRSSLEFIVSSLSRTDQLTSKMVCATWRHSSSQ